MKSDAIVVGAELDGLLAAVLLRERGYSVQLLSSGAGSLHYAPAGIHVLGYTGPMGAETVAQPFDAFEHLTDSHPYRKLGEAVVRDALAWFNDLCDRIDCPFEHLNQNVTALSPVGLGAPIAGRFAHQATFEALRGKAVVIVNIEKVRDFNAALLAAALEQLGVKVSVISAPLPGKVSETVALAKTFDTLVDPSAYFAVLNSQLPNGAEVALFPAVLGLDCHTQIVQAAERVLGLT